MEHFPYIVELFKHKFRSIRIPVLIAADNPSLDFALRYRTELFPSSPIVFCGINGYRPEMIAGQKRITGVAERLDTKGTVEQMLRLHPDTSEIVVVHDFTSTGIATRHEAEQDLQHFRNRVKIRFMEDVTTAELLAAIRKLPQKTLLLSLSYSRDREGRVFDHSAISRLLSENSPVPVYGVHEERLGFGIIGGSLLGGRYHASKAALMAVEILNGRDPDSMPVFTGTNSRLMFDYKQLLRFNIPLSRIPSEANIINQPVSFYEKYTTLVWTAVGVFVALAVIISLLVINITQKHRSTMELAEKAAELERSNTELREFNILAYHDLQEPLRVIGGFVQLLQKRYRGRLDPEADEYIELVVQNVAHLKQLFNDFLNYLQLNPSRLKPSCVETDEILRTVLGDLKQSILENSAEITFDRLPPVKADPRMLSQVFMHLISNALKFRTEAPRITIYGRREKKNVLISVSDNGIGIESKYFDKIFLVFRRLHNRSEYTGTGIGLCICKKIVELHGGRIWLESEPGKGSTFHFSLPGVEKP